MSMGLDGGTGTPHKIRSVMVRQPMLVQVLLFVAMLDIVFALLFVAIGATLDEVLVVVAIASPVGVVATLLFQWLDSKDH